MHTPESVASIEVPRHVKKPGGLWKRVENHVELAEALKAGWLLKVPAPTGIVLTDAPDALPASVEAPEWGTGEAVVDEPDEDEGSDDVADVPEPDAPVRRGPGRPRKNG